MYALTWPVFLVLRHELIQAQPLINRSHWVWTPSFHAKLPPQPSRHFYKGTLSQKPHMHAIFSCTWGLVLHEYWRLHQCCCSVFTVFQSEPLVNAASSGGSALILERWVITLKNTSPQWVFDLFTSQSDIGQMSKCQRNISQLITPTRHILKSPFCSLLISWAAFDSREAGTVCHSQGRWEPARRGRAMKIWLSTCPPQFIKQPSEHGAWILTLIMQSLGGEWHREASSTSCCAVVKMRC